MARYDINVIGRNYLSTSITVCLIAHSFESIPGRLADCRDSVARISIGCNYCVLKNWNKKGQCENKIVYICYRDCEVSNKLLLHAHVIGCIHWLRSEPKKPLSERLVIL